MSKIEEKVKSIIVDKLCVEKTNVVDGADLRNDLGADSLDSVEIIMECEKEFDISVPEGDWDKLNTVSDIVTYIKNKAVNYYG